MSSFLTTGTGQPYATIQAAVNAAQSGDTVGVGVNAGNTYPEAILVAGKYLHLIGLVENQGIALPGAGGGAAPCVNVTGTGGVILENFTCSNNGSAHTDVLTLNVYQHWVRRVRVNGTGGKVCFRAQYVENSVAYGGLDGFRPSCPGQNILKHVTCVDMAGVGLLANVANGDFEACLVFNCVGACLTNAVATIGKWNSVSDGSAPGVGSRQGITLADCAFVNYGAGDVRLTALSALWFLGVSPLAVDLRGKRRLRLPTPGQAGFEPRIYSGAFDPWPIPPAFMTGASAIRVV